MHGMAEPYPVVRDQRSEVSYRHVPVPEPESEPEKLFTRYKYENYYPYNYQ